VPAFSFRNEQRSQLGDIFCVDSTTDRKDNLTVHGPLNFQHLPSPGPLLFTMEGNRITNHNILETNTLSPSINGDNSPIGEI
jgi:hypothetical protein